MKIPGPMIVVLLIIVLLFCCTSGLSLQNTFSVFSFESAQNMMSGDIFDFMRPRVSVSDIISPPTCLVITGTGDERQLSEIRLTSSGSCTLTIAPSDADVRTLPLQFVSGQVRVRYTPTSSDDESAIELRNRVMSIQTSEAALNVSISRSGGTLTVECQNACSLSIGD